MTLTPESRVMLTEALRPPVGYRIDVAVGTSYSLDLTALLLAPLAFALFDHSAADELEDDDSGLDPIRLLEAVRRYAEHTTVFCQAGGIAVPTTYRSILAFVEDSVLEVMPPAGRSLFHPKIWALRFEDHEGHQRHRLVILSRNLTFDRSWDTALVLDESERGTIDAAPAADFLRRLPELCITGRGPSIARRAEIDDLARSLATARLEPPPPFTEGRLISIGLNDDPVWPFPDSGTRVLAISPFLTAKAVSAISGLGATGERTLVSRAESFDLLGSTALNGWSTNVLQRQAESAVDEDPGTTPAPASEQAGVHEGLHAKTFVVDLPGVAGCTHTVKCRCRSLVVTGSANLTSAPWGRSVEFDAALIGPTPQCGVQAVLDDHSEVPGLNRILETYTASSATGITDPAIDTSYAIEQLHRQLAQGGITIRVDTVAEDQVRMTLTLTIPPDSPGSSSVWPATLSAAAHSRPLETTTEWIVSPTHVTPFVAIETTAGEGPARATRVCVLKAELTGDVADRKQRAIAEILHSPDAVLRYLALLLGDPSYDSLFEQLGGQAGERWASTGDASFSAEVALFEPLVRAVGRDTHALSRVASLVDEVRSLPNCTELVPEGFDDLWNTVWTAHQELYP